RTGQCKATSSLSVTISSPFTQILPRSKPSMASVIDTAIAEPVSRLAYRLGRSLARWRQSGGGRWPISPLTRRILAVNVLALALLAGGFLYLGKYQASLVGQQIEALKMQGEVFAAALGEGAV